MLMNVHLNVLKQFSSSLPRTYVNEIENSLRIRLLSFVHVNMINLKSQFIVMRVGYITL